MTGMPKLLMLSALLAGCGGDLPSADMAAVNLGLQRPGAWAVWTRDAGGRAATYFLDERGGELCREAGIVLRTRAGELLWREERVAVPTGPCEPPGLPPGEGWETRGLLLPRAGAPIEVDPRLPLTSESGEAWIPNEVTSHLELRGSVGSILFLHRSQYAYDCGAHGNTVGDTFAWDLESRARVDLSGEAADDVARVLSEAMIVEDDETTFVGESLRLTGMVPRHNGHGLFLAYQLTADTCYACTRGDAGSYTVSELVGANTLPASLARHAILPPAVARFAGRHPELTIGGVGADERDGR
jgi:hypothetical protein